MRGPGAFRAAMLLSLIVFVLADHGWAQSQNRQQDEQALRQTAKEYLTALARGDAKALAAIWTEDADFIDAHGRSYPASQLVAAAAQTTPVDPSRAISEVKSTIRLLDADTAIEDGATETSAASGAGGRFTAVWVKRQGKWRLASLREFSADPSGSASELAALDWMVGRWSAKDGNTTLKMDVEWNANHTFLLRDLELTKDGKVLFRGTQRIGWDPSSRKVKSWIFDSDGGHGDGTWSREPTGWVVQTTGVLTDGSTTSATNLLTRESDDRFRWKSTAARTRGQSVPDLDLLFTREASAEKKK